MGHAIMGQAAAQRKERIGDFPAALGGDPWQSKYWQGESWQSKSWRIITSWP
jgi:hypothetical protein